MDHMDNHTDNHMNNQQDAGSIGEYHGFNQGAEDEVHHLAKSLSHQTFHSSQIESSNELARYLSNMSNVPGVETFNPEDIDPRLDPDSDKFDSKFWIKNLKKLRDNDQDYYKPTSLAIGYKNLVASGIATDSDYQATVTNAIPKVLTDTFNNYFNDKDSRYFDILKSMDGLILPKELTVVLGRPGSGCTTFLKTIAAQTYGFKVHPQSEICYDGLTPTEIKNHHRGYVIYSAESDIHFPNLMVGDTLEFAARLNTPQNRGNIDRETYAKHLAAVYMATYGLSHTRFTKVGNDFVRGVSGGERKRVSIAEASLSGANIQCWDNATRGLDAATALEFIKALKTSATVLESTPLIAIYQCSQDAYDLFDNVILMYEGYQVFFGKAERAKQYFLDMGYECPDRQTSADFLTSITNPVERVVKPGFEKKVPRTAQEFEAYWKKSPEYATLMTRIDEYFLECKQTNTKQRYLQSHAAKQANRVSSKSPFKVSYWMQIKYLVSRNVLRLKSDPSISVFMVLSQIILGFIVSSLYYNLQPNTGDFYMRGVALFMSAFFNAFASLLEIITMYEARPVVEKHKQFALYRPSADGLASIFTDLPIKFFQSAAFNIVFYVMVHFRRDAGRFFYYWLMSFSCTIAMSHIFRTIGASTKTMSGALTSAAALLIALVVFTGFTLPTPTMLGWSRWMNYLDPMAYAFEGLVVNEFHGIDFKCSQYIPDGPGYENFPISDKICSVVGAVQGKTTVNGDDYIRLSFEYANSHKWRNFGILIAFIVFFLFVYFAIIEVNKGAMQKGEIVLFLKSALKKHKRVNKDEETNLSNEKLNYEEQAESSSNHSHNVRRLQNQNIFHWRDLTYHVNVKKEERILLNKVDGWVKPGQLTALMGSSGAGKTTLLNTLSERLTVGVITDGNRMVNGHELDNSFQRSIGYAQQQDVHIPTTTVREALRFSAYLRQPSYVSKKEKDEYVEYCIDLLDMEAYSDALVGIAGEGLNVEQRKRLTIGVELAAKPKLLLFLDEPTSGLDSQTAWSICKLMRKLADHGQAILCTIHQPSAILLKEFDRLLFLQTGGETVYFGELGKDCRTLIDYFERNGADPCLPQANPAEWMLHVVGAAPGSHAKQNYFEVWRNSIEYQEVQKELTYLETELSKLPRDIDPDVVKTYAADFFTQYRLVTTRIIVDFWRTPVYIYSKLFLVVSSGLFIGFVFFKAHNTMQGLQNQMFSVFMSFIPMYTLLQQIMPSFVFHRSIYETREAPSKTFSWATFILGIISAEMVYQVVIATIYFFCYYYPVGLYKNAEPTGTVHERGALVWLFFVVAYLWSSTFGHLTMSFNEVMDNAANLAMFILTLGFNFCGALVQYKDMPGFWKFLYRVHPFTYMIGGILSAGLGATEATCSDYEYLKFTAPSGQTCGSYMGDFISSQGGKLLNNDTSNCEYCSYTSSDQFLERINAPYDQRWRDFGITVCFVVFNICASVLFYYLSRVPKGRRNH